MPFNQTKEWLTKESHLGSPNTYSAVLATTNLQAIPHNRVVAIKEIKPEGILFFTQRNTRKYKELLENPKASITFWLALQQRQIIIEGDIIALNAAENLVHWQTMPRERQLRFSAYASTSAQPIQSICLLEEKYDLLAKQFNNKDIPMSEYYCGFRLMPHTFCFYTLGRDAFSEVIKFTLQKNDWQKQLISP
jgi:pyridoxamine 5'-phosphate oxidase